jgi:hypothetical protein
MNFALYGNLIWFSASASARNLKVKIKTMKESTARPDISQQPKAF